MLFCCSPERSRAVDIGGDGDYYPGATPGAESIMQSHLSLRWIIILFAAVLLVGMLTALACGPAAPGGQDAKPTVETGATPMPTSAPGAGTSPDDLPGLDALLRARVAEHEAAQSSSEGARGTPQVVGIYIAAHTDASGLEIQDLLVSHGATSVRNTGSGNTNIFADVPASVLRTLSERTDISYMSADPLPYPKMDDGLNGLAVLYAAGLLPDEDTDPTFARMVIAIDGTGDEYDAIKRFLDDGGAIMAYGDAPIDDTYKPIGMLVAYVPVRLYAELHGKPGIFDISHELYPVPPEMRVTDHGEEEPGATEKSVGGSAPGSENGVRSPIIPPPELQPTPAGGAVAWHSDGHEGQGVKVGVIDLGYDGYQALIPKPKPRWNPHLWGNEDQPSSSGEDLPPVLIGRLGRPGAAT